MSSAIIRLHVTPRGSKNEVVGWRDELLCLKVTSPPVDGAANEAVVKYVADVLGVRKSQVELVAGQKSREKTVKIEGLSQEEAVARAGERCKR